MRDNSASASPTMPEGLPKGGTWNEDLTCVDTNLTIEVRLDHLLGTIMSRTGSIGTFLCPNKTLSP
jgi:hypothetical protein